MMAVEPRIDLSEDVTDKVLRRAEVAKMARKLQDRLALASYKTKNGLDSLSFNLVEAHFEETVSRRRPASSLGSSGSSTTSSDMIPYNRALQSSPLSAPIFSDDVYPGSDMGSRKRARFAAPYNAPTPTKSGTRSRRKRTTINSSPTRSRRSQPRFSASSPLAAKYCSDFRTSHGPELSFVSSSSTISDSPTFGNSDSEAPALPRTYHGSPPRTPPPTRSRGVRGQKSNGEEGADLLLYLATSPSPAQAMKNTPRNFAPSTPPQNHAVLPSSMMQHTPGGGQNIFTGFSTPGQQFNFADFVNVTPSPAQGAFNRTPGPAKTPLAAREARRRLNFDQLQPPTGSPNLSRSGGLGMDLGGALH